MNKIDPVGFAQGSHNDNTHTAYIETYSFKALFFSQVLEPYIDTTIDLRLYMLCLLPPLLAINMIRNLKFLAPLSMVANVCIVMGVVITFYYTTQDIPPLSSRLYVAPLSKIPLFFGTAIFALEGIGVVSEYLKR